MKHCVDAGEQLVPALYVRDLEESSRFYRALGFETTRREGVFMELRWESSLLFLVRMEGQPPPPARPVGNIRILVESADEAWEKAKERGLPVGSPPEDRYYGLREFTVAGPDGLNIRVASKLRRS